VKINIWWVIAAFVAGSLLPASAAIPELSRWWFIAFFYLGSVVGVVVMGLCVAARRSDDQPEECAAEEDHMNRSAIATNA
jgi:uncharacterized membrane protein YdcZ (DUF606 family)